MRQDTAFFHEHAGYSYDPATETPEQGRTRCAVALATAETWAENEGIRFGWEIDPDSNSGDFSGDPDPWALWSCFMVDRDGNVCRSLHAIDFGRFGEPWGDNYKRVIEAELALEQMPEPPPVASNTRTIDGRRS